MQAISVLPPAPATSRPLADHIPKLDHKEAGQLAAAEVTRFIAVVESLAGGEWERPTMCTEWNVRDILAHQAGAYASGASFAEFRRQGMGNPYMKEEKMPIDAINRRQLADRAGRDPAMLLHELRSAWPKAIANRQKLPALLRAIPLIDFGPPLGRASLGYLTDNIFTRDTWMHRLDICVATEREMVLSAAHDGRITALVVRDLAQLLRPFTREVGFALELTGQGGGAWQLGPASSATTITMATLDFHILASGRATAGDMVARGHVSLSGDADFGKKMLAQFSVPY